MPSTVAALDVTATERRRIVARERQRYARDLHDLLGSRLSAVTLQCELAHRLLAGQTGPEADLARSQLALAMTGMREVHAEVRRVAHGYHCLSLETELESVRALLESAGVRTDVLLPARQPLPAPVQNVLAAVAREAVNNVLRHSRARHCTLVVEAPADAVRLSVTNDGAAPAVSSSRPGIGLRSLTERLAAVGGSLMHEATPDGRFVLRASLPPPTGR